MYRTFYALIVTFAVFSTAYGFVGEISVTPANLDHPKYLFVISTTATRDAVTFHVTVAAKIADFTPGSHTALMTITHLKDSMEMKYDTLNKVSIQMHQRVWQSTFAVSRAFLTNPNSYFVFIEKARTTKQTKTFLPAFDGIYEMKLQDFFKN